VSYLARSLPASALPAGCSRAIDPTSRKGLLVTTSVKTSLATLALLSAFARPLAATDGYFVPGYGVKAQGRGGAGVAFPSDGLAGAINPAGVVFGPNRIDVGASIFKPVRSGTIVGNQLPPGFPNVNGSYDANDTSTFVIPEFGYTRHISPKAAFGLALYGNGGLNTSYTRPILLLGSSNAGVDLQQLFISPSVAFKLAEHQAIGVSLNIAYQRFKAEGLQNFATPTSSKDPGSVTNRGYDSSTGAGLRIGWTGDVGPGVTLGATYQTRTYAGQFTKYQGLFAEGGGFDIPANFAVGVAAHVHPKATVVADVGRILYGQVKSIGNSGANQALLGSDNGPGFGWQDITVGKLGVEVVATPLLTVRGGYNYSDVPFAGTETFFNLLAPGVVQHHLTLGATWLASGTEISVAYVHAFDSTVNGTQSIPRSAGGGNANVSMHQNSLSIGVGWTRR
jgi:long-chain fatty acid transport protein